jgi:hypothetical protein
MCDKVRMGICQLWYFHIFVYFLHILYIFGILRRLTPLYKYRDKKISAGMQKVHPTFYVSPRMSLMKIGEKMRGQEMYTEPPSDPRLKC